MRKIWVTLAIATLSVGLSIAPASAKPSDQDTSYLMAAHQSNLAEIAAGKMAQEKGTGPVVTQLGARFAADHTKLDDTLKPVAQQLGVMLPEEPNEEQKAIPIQLQDTPAGAEFDKLWLSTQLAAHEKSMSAGKTQMDTGTDPAAVKLATDAAPRHRVTPRRASGGTRPMRI